MNEKYRQKKSEILEVSLFSGGKGCPIFQSVALILLAPFAIADTEAN